jgi:hypothetical protein
LVLNSGTSKGLITERMVLLEVFYRDDESVDRIGFWLNGKGIGFSGNILKRLSKILRKYY